MKIEENDNELSIDMIEERLEICRKCPICDLDNWICNAKLYLNPITNDVSTTPKDGYIKGCNCKLNWKAKNPNRHCPAKKW